MRIKEGITQLSPRFSLSLRRISADAPREGKIVKRRIIFGLSAVGAAVVVQVAGIGAAEAQRSDAQIRRDIVRQSIAAYPGNCPCPYNTDRAGRRCGGRSAYSRLGGHSPKCYPSDVTAAEVARARGR